MYDINIGGTGKKLSLVGGMAANTAFVPGKIPLAAKTPEKFPKRELVPFNGPEEPYRKRGLYDNNRVELLIEGRFMEQGGVDHTGAGLARDPLAGKAVGGGVDNGLQSCHFFRLSKDAFSQKTAVYRRPAGLQHAGAKTADYSVCFGSDSLMAKRIHIQHGKPPLFKQKPGMVLPCAIKSR